MSNLEFNGAVVFVSDIEQSKTFYTEVLKREIETDFGNNVGLVGGIGLWQIREGHIVESGCEDTKTKSNRTELYFETTDIASEYEHIKANKVAFLHELIEEPWGQLTIRFFDPDHHLIEIGESLATFVKRMFNEGMSEIQVSEKTGIPLETVKDLLK